MSLNPEWVYKKTDSVLRGNVLAELNAILEITGLKNSLLIPANPGMGRTIVNRKYIIGNEELVKTSFAQDPDYPRKSSDVLNILGEFEQIKTGYLTSKQSVPLFGVFIGETKNQNSLDYWAKQINDQVLPAGAAEFFAKILRKKGYKLSQSQKPANQNYGRILFICGSAHQNSRIAIEQARENGASIIYMPQKLTSESDNVELEKWCRDICLAYKNSDKIILTVADNHVQSRNTARRIQGVFGQIAILLLSEIKLNTLVIEGGETAQEITKSLNINRFYPNTLLAPGVVSLFTNLDNPSTVIIKPGSYLWPQFLWRFS